MPEGELEYVFQFNRLYSEEKFRDAYELYRKHPDLVAGLNRATLLVVVMDFRNAGMMIFQKLFQSRVSKRVLNELIEDFGGHGADIRPQHRGFSDVFRRTDAGDENFSFEVVIPINCDDLFNHPHAVLSRVIETADERTHKRRARFGGKKRLIG